MVRTDSTRRSATFAGSASRSRSRFAVDYLFLRKMLAKEAMTPKDIEIVEMALPDMPAVLYAKAGCLLHRRAVRRGRAEGGLRVPDPDDARRRNRYLRCVLTVRQSFIDKDPALVQDLVNHVQGAGMWLDQKQENRDKAIAIAAGKSYFNQDVEVLRFVMENLTDRVTYGDLRMIKDEFDELMNLSIDAGTLAQPVAYETYVDERFAKATVASPITI
ncbi:MAG: ABC transporter substrate-binding protein [Acidobacteriota bacterium]